MISVHGVAIFLFSRSSEFLSISLCVMVFFSGFCAMVFFCGFCLLLFLPLFFPLLSVYRAKKLLAGWCVLLFRKLPCSKFLRKFFLVEFGRYSFCSQKIQKESVDESCFEVFL